MNEESVNKHRRSKFKRKTAWLENKGYIKTWKFIFTFKWESNNTKKDKNHVKINHC